MLRKICLATLVSALAIPAFGAVIRTGAYDLRLDMQTGIDPDAYSYPPSAAGLGYFVADNLECGVVLGLRNADWDSYWRNGQVWELGAFGEYHADVKINFHPLAGVRVSLLDGEENDDTVYQLFVYGGAKVFLNEHIALVLNAGVAAATEDMYDVESTLLPKKAVTQSGDSVGLLLDLGLRCYF